MRRLLTNGFLGAAAMFMIGSGLTVLGQTSQALGGGVIGAGAVLLVMAAFEFLTHRESPQPPPAADPRRASLHRADGRVVVPATPVELHELFRTHTTAQVGQLLVPFLGKWMEITGTVGDVHEQMILLNEYQPSLKNGVAMLFDAEWLERIAVLRRGDEVTVLGQIDRMDVLSLWLHHCELLKP